jgi:rubredoxin
MTRTSIDLVAAPLRRLMCLGCGLSYDQALGLPQHSLAPATRGKTYNSRLFRESGTGCVGPVS